jgi:hypothetical protein
MDGWMEWYFIESITIKIKNVKNYVAVHTLG